MFFVAAAIYAFGAIFYIIFASGELQPWAVEEKVAEDMQLNIKENEEEHKKRVHNGAPNA